MKEKHVVSGHQRDKLLSWYCIDIGIKDCTCYKNTIFMTLFKNIYFACNAARIFPFVSTVFLFLLFPHSIVMRSE